MSDKNAIVAAYDTHQDRTAFGGYYLVRGVGPVLVAGPLATYIVKTVEPANIFGWLERHRLWTLQHRNSEEQRVEVRVGARSRQVPSYRTGYPR